MELAGEGQAALVFYPRVGIASLHVVQRGAAESAGPFLEGVE